MWREKGEWDLPDSELFEEYLLAVNPDMTRLRRIAELLRKHRHAVVGGHARNAHTPEEPRATADLDVILEPEAARAFAAEVAAILPEGSVTDRGAFLVVRRGKKKVIDIGFPDVHPVHRRAFEDAETIDVPAMGVASVAPREVIVAMKALSSTSPDRRPAKAKIDEGDALTLLEKPVDVKYLDELALLLPDAAKAKLEELRRLSAE